MKKRDLIVISIWFALVLAGQWFRVNLSVGGQAGHLSLSMMLLPLIGYFYPGFRAMGLAALAFVVLHLQHPFPITMGIPTLLATLSWQLSKEKNGMDQLLHLGFPLLAMLYFIVKAPGVEAYPYALYWLIPVVCYFKRGLFARAFQSTFIAHATGSIIWVTLMPLSASAWFSLIPIVAVERMIIALFSITMISILSAKFALPKLRRFSRSV